MTLNAKTVAQSKYVAMLPQLATPWKIISHDNRVFAVNEKHAALVLYTDGWKEVQIQEADQKAFEDTMYKMRREALLRLNRPSLRNK